MIKLFAFLKRNPDLSRDEFHAHWRDVHGPLIRDTPELARHILRYEQHPRLADDERFGSQDWDGVAVQWFHSMEDLAAMISEPAYTEKLQPDEARLLDMGAIEVLFVEEPRVVIGGDR